MRSCMKSKVLTALAAAVGIFPGVAASGLAQEGAKALFYSGEGTAVRASEPARPGPGGRTGAEPAAAPRPGPSAGAPAAGTAARGGYFGIKYWVELVGRDGTRVEVTPDRVFRSGDRIRLRVETNRDGYLYLLNAGSTGRYHLLFPHPKLAGGSNLVKAGAVYDIPHGAFIRFDDNPGEEVLFIVLSPRPMTDMPVRADDMTRHVPDEDGRQLVQRARLQGAKDLVLEVDASPAEPRSYAVAPLSSLGEQGLLVLEVKLRHQ
jgi:hypothetical protein